MYCAHLDLNKFSASLVVIFGFKRDWNEIIIKRNNWGQNNCATFIFKSCFINCQICANFDSVWPLHCHSAGGGVGKMAYLGTRWLWFIFSGRRKTAAAFEDRDTPSFAAAFFFGVRSMMPMNYRPVSLHTGMFVSGVFSLMVFRKEFLAKYLISFRYRETSTRYSMVTWQSRLQKTTYVEIAPGTIWSIFWTAGLCI